MRESIEFTCPHCKNKFEVTVYPVINLQEDAELYEDLFSLELFKIECEHCKKVTMIEYNLLVVDMYKKYIIYLYKDNLDEFNTTKENFFISLQSNEKFKSVLDELKYTRVVTSLSELLEKLLIFDYDLNDKVINKLKDELFLQKAIDNEKYTNLNFEKIEKDKLVFTCYNINTVEIPLAQLSVNFNYYNQIIDSLNGLPKEEKFEYI